MLLISKAHRKEVFEDLIGEGVIVVKKDLYLPKHQHITSVPNIVVTIVVRSLKPRKHLNGVFNWQWSYYMLSDAEIKNICEYFGLPKDFFSTTYKKINVARENEEGDKKDCFVRFSENDWTKSKFLLVDINPSI